MRTTKGGVAGEQHFFETMPILVKDYTWRETEDEVTITLPLKGVKSSKADIFSTNRYIKVNYPPYLFEVHLYAPVLEEKCTAKIGNGVVNFQLTKEERCYWGRLASVESDDKEVMGVKRVEAIEHVQKTVAKLDEEKAKKKKEEETFAIKQEMRLEEEERDKIEHIKQSERERTEKELEEWKRQKKAASKEKVKPITTTTDSVREEKGIWKENKSANHKVKPAPRKGGSIQVRFTPRVFPTAARESKEQEEQEWLTKMAAARKISTPKDADSAETINERNPEFLKDKGAEFFKSGNYEAAVNAFSEAIKLNPRLPPTFLKQSSLLPCHGRERQMHPGLLQCFRTVLSSGAIKLSGQDQSVR